MDFEVLQHAARELNELLTDGFINKIHQPLPREIVLRIRLHGGGGGNLVLSADHQVGRIHLTSLRIPNPPRPPRLCAYLRAHFQGARIEGVNAAPDDRVVHIRAVRGGVSNRREMDLILELLGRDSNIILVDRSSNRIMECLHRIPEKETGTRIVVPGAPYVPPPKSTRRKRPVAHEGPGGRVSPGIRVEPGGRPRLVLDAVDSKDEIFGTINEAADCYYGSRLRAAMLDALRRQVAMPLKARIAGLTRRLSKIEADAKRLEGFESRGEEGELLKANLQSTRKGMESLTVRDWYTNEPRTIRLDPTLGPIANMERIFRKAAKGKRGREVTARRLEETIEEKRALEEILFFVETSQDTDQLEDTARMVRGLGRGPKPSISSKTEREPKSESKFVREFRTPSGRLVIVGKSAQGNDFLLRRKARKGDLWFHVKGMPGSHVLLPERSKEPASAEDMEYAAGLAVDHSKARGGGKVEVMVADAADLRRPKGALPGQVIVASYMTIVSDGAVAAEGLSPRDTAP
ncbi:MAG: NFACT family protein [Desulfomonilaceae bacterium]|nr:NFACT family protein [Desulfomonilaceae bacterium]